MKITVLGVGNPIMGDDGVGLVILQRLQNECEWLFTREAADHMPADEIGMREFPIGQTQVQEASVEFIDGGTGGMELVPVVQETTHLLILDAISPHKERAAATETSQGMPAQTLPNAAPSDGLNRTLAKAAAEVERQAGAVVRLSGDQVPRLLRSKLSPHQVSLLDVLTACRLLGTEPEHVEVVGVVAADVDLRVGLSPVVESGVPSAVQQAQSVLREWLQPTSNE
ncbi:MAG: hydrogenase maturation protease [Arcanobacterium sp.]|nr:hydrogenase maturation protease [Arcanobacterium sp.]MDY5588821.1 hydrogenase maturation protease [Arcanobacterium sp.]